MCNIQLSEIRASCAKLKTGQERAGLSFLGWVRLPLHSTTTLYPPDTGIFGDPPTSFFHLPLQKGK